MTAYPINMSGLVHVKRTRSSFSQSHDYMLDQYSEKMFVKYLLQNDNMNSRGSGSISSIHEQLKFFILISIKIIFTYYLN